MVNQGIKTISVGNLVMGGAGKTPHTLLIAGEMIKKGEKVAILSLGYKGKVGYDINVISDGNGGLYHHPPMAADEPYMMAKNYPEAIVITGKKREQSLSLARDKYGATVAILDDGYQYKKLARDANILLLDHKRPISTGFPFPFGYLREFPSAINRSDIIIFTRAKNDNIPEYRKIVCGVKIKVFVPFKGEQIISIPINSIPNKEINKHLYFIGIKQSLKEIESLISLKCENHHFHTKLSASIFGFFKPVLRPDVSVQDAWQYAEISSLEKIIDKTESKDWEPTSSYEDSTTE